MDERPVVLVVEDDIEMNELECELLDVHGLDSRAAYSGPDALDVAAQMDVDGVLLDLMLPEINGFETCLRLRAEEGRTRRMAIVVISALDNDESRRKSFDAGADAYFVKPFDVDEVIDTIQTLIRRRRGSS
ncbi:MAG: response regulator transcription factor [Planctomycetota bacterium]